MTSIPAYDPTTTTPTKRGTDLRDVDVSKFMDLLIAELKNQDPLNPMSNTEMAQQIAQIREIGATDKLSETLGAVLAGTNLATASSLIGKEVDALTSSGQNVKGVVDRVTVKVDEKDNTKREYQVHIGDQTIPLSNIRQVYGEAEE